MLLCCFLHFTFLAQVANLLPLVTLLPCYLVTLLHFTFLAQVEKKLASAHLAFHIQFQNQVSALQIGVVRLKGYHAKKAKRLKKIKRLKKAKKAKKG